MKDIEKFVSVLLVVFMIYGCTRNDKKSTYLSSKKLDSLKSHYELLNSEVSLNWSVMIEDDNEKLFSMKRLLEEVSYTGAYNVKQFNQLIEELEVLKLNRYSQETMTNSRLIDDYDSMSNQIISEVIDFAQHHPEFDRYPLMSELTNEIMESQYNVLHHRIRYDKAVDDYNYFLEENEAIINQITSNKVHSMPVFRIE